MDIQLYYEETGSGFPLILLHGNGENLGYFVNQIPCFSRNYRVIAVDTRGHGKSPRGTAEFSIRQFAEDLRAFMDLHSIEKAHILGFSDGANIALAFAMKYPDRVEKMVLDGGNLYPWGVKFSVQLPIEIGYYAAKLISLFDKNAIAKKELLGLMVTQPNLKPADLAGISTPTLVIAGTRDMIRTAHTKKIHEAIPCSVLRLIDGDHFVARDNPSAFNAAVQEFLG